MTSSLWRRRRWPYDLIFNIWRLVRPKDGLSKDETYDSRRHVPRVPIDLDGNWAHPATHGTSRPCRPYSVVLYHISERNFKRRIVVSEIASKSRKQVIGLPSELFPPKKDKWWGRAVHIVKESCNFMCDQWLSCACLPKKNETTFGVGLFTQLIMKSRNAMRVPIRHPLSGPNCEFNPYGISLIFESSSMTTIRLATQKSLTITYRHLKFELIFLPHRPEFGTL